MTREDTTSLPRPAKLTAPEVARHLRVSPNKILTFIRSGELAAINIASRPSGRPRYRIDQADLEKFEAKRAVAAVGKPIRQRRRSRDNGAIIQFF